MSNERLAQGRALKQAEKDRAVKRATTRRLNALEKEWVADTQFTHAELIAHNAQLRADMYARNPHLRAA